MSTPAIPFSQTSDVPLTTVQRISVPARVQPSYTTRFVAEQLEQRRSDFHLMTGPGVTPRSGDVVIARVTEILNHKRVETPESRKAILFEGALIMLAYGNRYAADQFLAEVPTSLQPCHLVAAGGVAGMVTLSHEDVDEPTALEPLGLLADAHGPVNLLDYAPFHTSTVMTPDHITGPISRDAFGDTSRGAGLRVDRTVRPGRPEVIAVLGTSMNSGKSTTMACLINGLVAAGRTVTAGKITGTGAGNDPMIYHDAGAARVLDFTDFGYPSTFRLPMEEIRSLTVGMVAELMTSEQGAADVVVVEIADGIYQEETARLLRDDLFQETIDHTVFAATDALGASAGVQALQAAGLEVSVASGVMTASPLATAEAAMVLEAAGVPVIPTFELTDARLAACLLRNRPATDRPATESAR